MALFFILLFSIQINTFSFSAKDISVTNCKTIVVPKLADPTNVALQTLVKMKTADIEKMIGRKLKFKEKIALKILKYKNRKNTFNDSSSKDGSTSEVLGVCALVTLFIFPFVTIPLAILALVYAKKAKNINPDDKKAHTGTVLAWVSLGILVLLAILIFILIASIGVY